MSDVGHNSGSIAGDVRLQSIVRRYEEMDEQIKEMRDDQKEIMAEAKSAGYDCKVLRRLIRERKQDAADLEEQETLLDVYRRALGDFATAPLGVAAMERAAAHA